MIGIIVLPGASQDMLGLDEHVPVSLLPLGDRPFLQHVIEFFALQGISSFEFILEHAPQQIEAYLGDGSRWGCRFRCHLVSQPERPYRCLRIIAEAKTAPTFLVHADQVPYIQLAEYAVHKQPILFCIDREGNGSSKLSVTWGGGILFPTGISDESIAGCSRQTLTSHLQDLESQGLATATFVPDWISLRTPRDLLVSQRKLLNREFSELMIGGTENDPKLWVSRNVVINPSARIVPPAYLGPNCRIGPAAQIGPNAVISGNSFIDAHTSIQNSLVTAGSYVGERLELDEVIIDRNLLVNVKLGTGLTITENFLLGRMAGPSGRRWFVTVLESIFAILLILLLLPFYCALAVYLLTFGQKRLARVKVVRLPATGDPRMWQTFNLPFVKAVDWTRCVPAGWASFFFRFLPGLPAVARARLNLVGLPPRTVDEIRNLPQDWRSLYLHGNLGLITEASLILTNQPDETEIYLAEACYCAAATWKHDFGLFFRYFLRLIFHQQIDVSKESESQS
ncbi:MAG TPA: NDP-sugar synthase [Edaphobacter sp.]|nr:NDP-sugar synthase [Edaphobacter sp.]